MMRSALAGVLLAGSAFGAYAVNEKPFTVPEVRQWKGMDGTLTLSATSRITYTNPKLAAVASQLAEAYKALTGVQLVAEKAKATAGDIELVLKSDKKLGTEGYSIDIDKRVVITAPTAEGIRWGGMTLMQLTEASPELPKGKITDFPDYGIRGFMLDAGRKYIPLDYLYKLVDVMAYYKMNLLHIGLNNNGFKYYYDDNWDKTQAAFRLECDTYPGLTARDGSYTKQEFRDLQKYALERGVEIVPEIDTPAHALAFTRYRPDLAPTDGHNDADHLNLANPDTYVFVDNLLKEYVSGPDPVFLSKRVHIGTDEYQGDSLAMEQFRAYTDHYIKMMHDNGKTPLIWGSLTHAKGQTPVETKDVLMYLWSNGYADPQAMLDLGYDVVSIPDGYTYIVPACGYYYDYLNTPMLYEKWTPALVGGKVNIGEKHPQLKGGMFAVWNDQPDNGITVKDIHHRIMAALPTMAAKTWDGVNVTFPYEVFAEKSAALSEAPGVNYLGRQGKQKGVVLEMQQVNPGTSLPLEEIGYNYTVDFDIDGADEAKGTVLFESPAATVWLSDPIGGTMAYSREGYLNNFRQDIRKGDKMHVTITGDNEGTQLYVNGKLVDDMSRRWMRFADSNRKMSQVRTLVFPLAKAGNFKSRISNLKVRNYKEAPAAK